MAKEVETFVGPCSKFVSGQGWTTEIPVELLHAKGYYKIETRPAPSIKFKRFELEEENDDR